MAIGQASQSVVAKAAGVSQTAVSLALRNHPSIPEATRERIKAIAEQVGYRPNPYIAALMKQVRRRRRVIERPTIAYVTSHLEKDGWRQRGIFRRYFEGASKRATELGYKLEEFWLKEPGMNGERLGKIFWTRSIDGAILAPLPHGRGHVHMQWDRIAAATINFSVVRPNLHRAANHQMQSLSMAVRRLVKLGYGRIGLAMPLESDARADHNWAASFLFHQEQMSSEQKWPMLVTEAWHEAAFAEWCRLRRPDVVISTDSRVVQWLGRMGLRIPTDVGFVCLEWGEDESEYTGIRQNARLVGAAAVDLVVEQLEHNERGLPDHPKTVLIGGDWVDGETVIDRTTREGHGDDAGRMRAGPMAAGQPVVS